MNAMSNLTAGETSDILAAIEIGWTKAVPAATFVAVDEYGEVAKEYTFYRFDGQVFCLVYENRTTMTICKEITGESLEMFNLTYRE